MQKLYSQCPDTANIEKAIRTVYSHEGAKTAGADGISKSSNISQERIVKEVKLRLRRYKPVQSRKVHIPKGNGEFRTLTIINLFDRIAQQAVYQIISPLLEGKMSKHSYGFRKGIGAKVPVSRLDIVNDMGNFLDKVEQRLYCRIKRGVLSKFGNVYQYGEGREKIFIDIYALRKTTKTSYKEYLIGSKWPDMRELLKHRNSDQAIYGAFQYLWSLRTKQKGKDAITKEDLDPLDAQIHHVKPFSKGGSNNLENLIPVSSKTHYLIHHGKDLDKRFEKYRKHLK